MIRAGHYDYKTYQAMVSTSQEIHLLVEGKGDRRFFEILLEQCHLKEKIHLYSVEDIDCFPDIPNVNGNRERIEHLCRQDRNNLFGFVDREFREFLFQDKIIDNIKTHNIVGNVLWSRGHSIENYCFSSEILREPFRGQTSIRSFSLAIDLFCENFLNILKLACILTYLAKELEIISRLNNLYFDAFIFESSKIQMDFEKLFSLINQRCSQITRQHYDTTLDRAKRLVSNTNSGTVRWFIHGHIGFETIISSFHFLLVKIVEKEEIENRGDKRDKPGRFRRIDDEQHFFNSLEEWKRHSQCHELANEIKKLCGITD